MQLTHTTLIPLPALGADGLLLRVLAIDTTFGATSWDL